MISAPLCSNQRFSDRNASTKGESNGEDSVSASMTTPVRYNDLTFCFRRLDQQIRDLRKFESDLKLLVSLFSHWPCFKYLP